MGDRRNVKLVYGADDSPVWLYTHWGGSELEDTVAAALLRGKGRWTDPAYLVRIIFSEMVRDEIDSETGYGIAPYRMDFEADDVVVDLAAQTVDGVPFPAFAARKSAV